MSSRRFVEGIYFVKAKVFLTLIGLLGAGQSIIPAAIMMIIQRLYSEYGINNLHSDSLTKWRLG